MRSLVGRTITLGICALAGLLWSGCSGQEPTEYVTGISTQVKVPRDIKAVRIQVTVGGSSQYCRGYRAYNGKVTLPGSLGTFANNDGALTAPITYTIVGVSDDKLDDNAFFTQCAPVAIGQNGARVLRRSTQPYIAHEVRYIPMPLKYSCFDKQCDDDETCKAGTCVKAEIDHDTAAELFPKYDPGLVDGSSGGCFDTKVCMGIQLPAIEVDPVKCIYAVAKGGNVPPLADPKFDPVASPLPPNTPWAGTNVQVVYDGGVNSEVLDLDKEEGFFIPDASKPQQFQLAPGLCRMVHGTDPNPGKAAVGTQCNTHGDCASDDCRQADPEGHPDAPKTCVAYSAPRITAITASGVCQSKKLAQPFCIEDQYGQMGVDSTGHNPTTPLIDTQKCTTAELKSPASGLVVVVDNTQGHSAFFKPDEIANVALPLTTPALEQTQVKVIYAGGLTCTGAPTQAYEFGRAVDSAEPVKQALIAEAGSLTSGEPNFETALVSSYQDLTSHTEFFKRAVLVVGNRDFDTKTCTTATTAIAAAQLAETDPAKQISTYALQLVDGPGDVPTETRTDVKLLAASGSAAGQKGDYAPDARTDKKNALLSFQKIINSLATCVYTVPKNAPVAGDSISYSNPVTGKTSRIDYSKDCTGEGTAGSGWGYDAGNKHVFVCGQSCSDYQQTLVDAAAFGFAYFQSALPVPIFAHAAACDVK